MCMRNACWIPRATNSHQEYETLFFNGNGSCTKDPQCHVVAHCLSCYLKYILKLVPSLQQSFGVICWICAPTAGRSIPGLSKILTLSVLYFGRSHWPRVLGRGSADAQDCYDSRFKYHQKHKCLPFECFVLSVRGLCFGLITRPEESYRV